MATASSPKSAGKTKQRVVGTAVLVALFIIIVLILPSRNEEEIKVLQVVEIPPKPVNHNVKVLAIEVPKPPRRPNVPKEPGAIAPSPGKTESKPEPKPVASKPAIVAKSPDKSVDQAPEKPAEIAPKTGQKANQNWVIQVGSFSSKENARALRDRLKADNYKVFVGEVNSNGQLNFRVLIGPNADRTKLEPFKVKLEKLLNAPAIIKSYEP